jgi:hypothetical protein
MLERPGLMEDQDIDVVVLWVDGNDPALTEKRMHYLRQENLPSTHPGALSTRFASSDEIRYCLLSILKFAPFVRRIHLVTDGQDPGFDADLERYFPERKGILRIVDHTAVFRGYEHFLPSFNATSISSMIWRIEGLAENFIYFNDDMFLLRPTASRDWFVGNRPVLRGRWKNPPYRKMAGHGLKKWVQRHVLGNRDYSPRISYFIRQWRAARLLGLRTRYFFHDHTAHPMNRKVLEAYFHRNPGVLERNIKARFRAHDQFLITALAYHLEILNGDARLAPINLCYIHPWYSRERLHRKLDRAQAQEEITSICVQSLDMLDEEIARRVFGWMDELLGIGQKPENSH